MSISNKLTSAALAGLLSASVMTAGAAFANEEKAGCKGKAGAEKAGCKAADGKEASHCNGKDKEGKSHCASKDGEAK